VYDLFAGLDLEQMIPEASNLLKGTVACGVVGNIWNANLTFFTVPGQRGPCGLNNYQGLAAGPNCQTGGGTLGPNIWSSNPWGDEYIFWTNFISVYTSASKSPDCYDYESAAFHGANRNWGGRPYCSFYTDLSPRFPSCAEVARFRRTTEDDYETEGAHNVNQDPNYPSPSISPLPHGVPPGGYNYTFEFCSQPNTVKNPFYMNIYELVSCDAWTLCDNQDINIKWGYKDYYDHGTFPICNPCNCAGGQGVGTGGFKATGRDYSCGGQGVGTGGFKTTGRDYSCGGQGVGTGGFKGTGRGAAESKGLPVADKFDMNFLAESFELLTQLDVVGAIQAAEPWQEIFGRLCSCACGPSN